MHRQIYIAAALLISSVFSKIAWLGEVADNEHGNCQTSIKLSQNIFYEVKQWEMVNSKEVEG